MCGSGPVAATAEMGRLTDADGDGNVRKVLPRKFRIIPLDSNRFIEAFIGFFWLN
jgi:hypothetical protein